MMTAAQALRAVEDGDHVDADALGFLKEHGRAAKRKGGWVLTVAGKGLLAPAPAPTALEDGPRETIAARLRPQPDTPNPFEV